jgi:hypothetical protein
MAGIVQESGMQETTAGKVPIIECVRSAWTFPFEHWRKFLPAALVAAAIAQIGLILGVLTAAPASAPQTVMQSFLGDLMVMLPSGIAGLMFTAAVLRKAVRDEYVGRTGIAFGADEVRLLGAAVAMLCLFLPLVALLFIVLSVAVFSRIATSDEALQALLADPEALNAAITAALGEGGSIALSLFILLICALFIVMAARLYMINSATIGERKIVLLQTWSWSRGNVLRVIAAMILTVLPVMMIDNLIVSIFTSLPAPPEGAGTSLPLLLFAGFSVSFVTAMTSIPVVVLGAILYKGLRPRDFVAK